MSVETRSDSYTAGMSGEVPAPYLAVSATNPETPAQIEDVPAEEPRGVPVNGAKRYVHNVPSRPSDPTGLFAGIRMDIRNRWDCYYSDWTDHFSISLLAPATYIFFASVIPALTFGEQIADHTNGELGGAQVLLPTAICGLLQALFGGQPLLIVGVAEPIVLVYVFMYEFCQNQDPVIPFRPFAAATLYWAALFIVILAAINACKYIHTFTRFSGELFGLLIAVLFFQQGVRGLKAEFKPEVNGSHGCDDGNETHADDHLHLFDGSGESHDMMDGTAHPWLMFNGTWACFLALGLVVSTIIIREARTWNYFKGPIRKFVAEYATFITVFAWTGISFVGTDLLPEGIPRRLKIDSTIEAPATDTWNTVSNMDELSGEAIAIAIVPAIIITIMNVFDHNVSAQLAQVEEFKLEKPHAYHWDFFLQGIMTAICGACGIMPVNGVIPQSPLHTRACAEYVRNEKGERSKDSFVIREQRWTNLIQSLLVTVCLFITDALKQVPRSVLWGFFLYLALESLPGSQFFERLQLFITDSKRLKKITRGEHNTYLDKVPFNVVVKFTITQFVGFGVCYGISQIPTCVAPVGIFFPTLIMLLVPARIYLFPKMFSEHDLYYLDPRENAEAPADAGDGTVAEDSISAMAKKESFAEDVDVALEAGGIGATGLSMPTKRLNTAMSSV